MSVENTHFLFSNIFIKYLNKCYNIGVNSYNINGQFEGKKTTYWLTFCFSSYTD